MGRWQPSRGEIFVGLPRRFLEIFFALSNPHGFRSNSKESKKTVFIVFLDLKDFGGFILIKADERCHDFSKNGEFLVGF